MKLLTSMILIFLGTSSFAFASGSNCADSFEVFDNTQVQAIPGNHTCYITVHPRDIYDMIYRDFLFDDNGLFLIFNSFGDGTESDMAGAREFYFFPRKNKTSYSYDATKKLLSVTSPSGKIFTFNTVKSILVGISNTTFTQDYKVDKSNKGGIEITKNDGVFLDLGFTLGQSPSQNPKRSVVFKDSKLTTCGVKNADIFKYTVDSDSIFKYNDSQLGNFLSKSCPQLAQ